MKILKPVIPALLAALVLKLFVFDIIIAQGDSMEPAIRSGSVLVVNRLRYGLRLPLINNKNNNKNEYLIRWAAPKTGEVLVFYTPEGEKAVKRCAEIYGGNAGMNFYAYGDNSLASYDSRSYGPVPVDNIIGKVLGR